MVQNGLPFGHAEGKRLVDDHGFAGIQRFMRLRGMQVVWGGDDDQFDVRIGQGGGQIGHDAHIRQVGLDVIGP